jgi:shikimate dehydrogenase
MTPASFTGAARVAGLVGAPVRQSLSPLIHNAWIAAAGLDAVYAPFSPAPGRFEAFVEGVRRAGLSGLNVTLPFKEAALACADQADTAAHACGAANLLLFDADGRIEARNTDGVGLLDAFAEQAPTWRPQGARVLVLGAGGAARAAVSALCSAGAEVRVINRTHARAVALVEHLGVGEAAEAKRLPELIADASAIVNATAAGLEGAGQLEIPLARAQIGAVVMDMVYKPLRTPLLSQAAACGLNTVDGLAMLIGQARPSFKALFGVVPPAQVDVRALALAALKETPA